jgi:hypothetical protein
LDNKENDLCKYRLDSADETQKQYEAAEYIISEVKKYIGGKNYD